MYPHLVLFAETKWRNRIFKKRLEFLALKRMACLLESPLKSAVSGAIIAQKWRLLRLLLSRKITKFLISLIKRFSKNWLKRLLWRILFVNFSFQLHLSFKISRIFTLRIILADSQSSCHETSIHLQKERWVLLHKIVRISTSSLTLRVGHKRLSEITFFAMIELSNIRWKSWINLAENPMNTELSNNTRNSYDTIVRN